MRIYSDVRLQGATSETTKAALIDTGAEISMLPFNVAVDIGAWRTNQQADVVGVHGESRTLPIVAAHLYFPLLKDIGGRFIFVMSDTSR